MNTQRTLETFGSNLSALTPNCYHYWRPRMEPPFLVWAEDGEDGAFSADNRKGEMAIGGSLHYFTPGEYDPLIDTVCEHLNNSPLVSGWLLNSVQYEDDTNLIHYEWHWTVMCSG